VTRRTVLAVVAVAALAIVAAVVVVDRALSRPRRLPVVVTMWVTCPTWSGGPPTAAAPGAGPLLPDTDYHSVYVCADGETRQVRARILSGADAAELVRRLNALPRERPSGDCAKRGPLFDVVFAAGPEHLVLQVDSARCGVVHHDGVSRYGGDEAHRTIAHYIDSGDL
jgi:hypothetical protein